jgi:predicted transcriptional regulator of viral defense system
MVLPIMYNNTISALGKKEAELVARLAYEKKDMITAKELDEFLPPDFKYRKQLVYALKKKKILIPVKRGVYIFVPLEAVPTGRRVNDLLIPPIFFPKGNYYIGYSTAYNYYSLTEQLFQTIYILNTYYSQQRLISGLTFKFVRISPKCLYGLEKINIRGTEVLISSKERTLVDLIYFNKPVGGIQPAIETLKKIVEENQCNIKKFVQYAAKFPNITTRKRIGVCLEGAGITDVILKPLIKSVTKTAISSLGRSRKGTLNKKWRVIVDAP